MNTKHLQDLTIMIIDDDQLIREKLTQLFTRLDAKVLTACNGLEGLEIIKVNEIDVIVSDVNMPKMDGLSLIEKIREFNEELDFIFISSISTPEYLMKAIKNSALNYITKPININELIEYVNKIYDKKKKKEEQKSALEIAEKAKDDFLANMSHELKTPLNSINTLSSIMMKNKDNRFNQRDLKSLNIINNCGNDLLFLINDVLDLSKLEAKQMKLNYEVCDIKSTIFKIKEIFYSQAKEKNLDFIFRIDDSLDEIFTDENRLKQIIKNLLSNAIKFSTKGVIRFYIKDLEKDIQIVVSDDGIGISAEKLAHIFDRFKQADESTTRKYGGTGLGLAICKDLIELFEGDIQIKSEVNVGTTVTVTIPKKLNMIEEFNKFKLECIL